METHQYYLVPFTTGLWKHLTRKQICLCVEYFAVNYFSRYDADHLLSSPVKFYEISTDWENRKYPVFTLKWNHKEVYVNILMPEYLARALERLQNPKPK